ncbi:glycosyltransferase, partial [Kluyvera sp. Awk 3]|uniref:glycosyltransferase n=1 Tax=Kluyvera sp. Awk 3 TaxID=2963956 RepID=UPI002304C934
TKEKIKVVWIGNSRWGEYLGHLDYKGLNSVVLPALKKFENSGRELIYKEFDSSKEKNTHEVILDYLKDADILLVSSLAEGTPLPLLEAMAQGCAIITSDVGIASEIFSEEQQEFIVPRNSDAFTEALIKLDTNRSLLENIKKTNKLTYIKKFVES